MLWFYAREAETLQAENGVGRVALGTGVTVAVIGAVVEWLWSAWHRQPVDRDAPTADRAD